MGAPRAICFSGLARPQSSLQTHNSGCDVGHFAAALDDRHLYDLPGNDHSRSNAEPALSTLSLCGPLTLDLFFQRSREQQLQTGRQCRRDYESLFSARLIPAATVAVRLSDFLIAFVILVGLIETHPNRKCGFRSQCFGGVSADRTWLVFSQGFSLTA